MNKHPTFGHSGFLMESPTALQGTGRRAPAWVAGLLWLAAGLSAGYWVLLAAGRSPVTPLSVAAPSTTQVDTAAVARVLGALPQAAQTPAVPVATGTQYSLLGVVAANAPDGAALIAVNGQPPRPYRVGASLEGGLVLQAVSRRGARLGASINGPATVELTLPATTPS
ncbi:type II secretion system protein N [Hydrogenophaga sp.]|uniref:type II secretion system protein N n=1 Tax=Hydrogenophaga sp. TaxID=1904254 RepID=UPI002730AAFE|nr:type II secretion system protein N [Hydrogenophaga sp.]MDP2017739.1 type II secretion system protein N [Hydrogenophaga sp.]MDP3811844.1 type II secretion system protein N [Hydrogenophaga sp.]